ncbi:MAG: DUF370 domain-containing protein [Desulfobacterales bacterium]
MKQKKKKGCWMHRPQTRSIIILRDNHIVLSASQPDTIAQRYLALKEKDDSNQ